MVPFNIQIVMIKYRKLNASLTENRERQQTIMTRAPFLKRCRSDAEAVPEK